MRKNSRNSGLTASVVPGFSAAETVQVPEVQTHGEGSFFVISVARAKKKISRDEAARVSLGAPRDILYIASFGSAAWRERDVVK